MEQEWVSLNEYMRKNHIGYETALKLMRSGKVEYQKIGGQYKIKVSKDKEVNATIEKLIRENEELKTYIRTIQSLANQVKIWKEVRKMVDEIYSIWTAQDLILIFSLFINIGLFLDYIDRKITKKSKGRRKKYVRK